MKTISSDEYDVDILKLAPSDPFRSPHACAHPAFRHPQRIELKTRRPASRFHRRPSTPDRGAFFFHCGNTHFHRGASRCDREGHRNPPFSNQTRLQNHQLPPRNDISRSRETRIPPRCPIFPWFYTHPRPRSLNSPPRRPIFPKIAPGTPPIPAISTRPTKNRAFRALTSSRPSSRSRAPPSRSIRCSPKTVTRPPISPPTATSSAPA